MYFACGAYSVHIRCVSRADGVSDKQANNVWKLFLLELASPSSCRGFHASFLCSKFLRPDNFNQEKIIFAMKLSFD